MRQLVWDGNLHGKGKSSIQLEDPVNLGMVSCGCLRWGGMEAVTILLPLEMAELPVGLQQETDRNWGLGVRWKAMDRPHPA